MNLGSARQGDDLHETMLRFLDDGLPPEAVLEFNTRLKTDLKARQEFTALLLQQVQLEEIGQEQKILVGATISPKAVTGNPWFLPAWLTELFRRKPGTLYHLFASPRTLLTWAMCGALCLGIALYLFLPIEGAPMLLNPVAGSVTLWRNGSSFQANEQMSLQLGDLIVCGPANGTTIQYGKEPTQLHLEGSAELKILPWNRGKRLQLRQGILAATVAHQRPFKSMVITTPQAEVRVLGTRFSLNVTNNATRLDVAEGKVRFTRTRDRQVVRVAGGSYVVAAADYELAALPFTGKILREFWRGVSATSLRAFEQDPRFPAHPDGCALSSAFELEPTETNQLVVRFSGYLHPPISGNYEFWLAGASTAELFLSPAERAEDRIVIAQTSDGTPARSWDAPRFQRTSQWAPPIPLVAGRRYYIEGLVLVQRGVGHLSVAWKGPGRPRELLTSEFLSPAEPKK